MTASLVLFIVFCFLFISGNQACPDYSIQLIVDETVKWRDCQFALTDKTTQNLCNCFAGMLNALGGSSCIKEMSVFVRKSFNFSDVATELYGDPNLPSIGNAIEMSFKQQNWNTVAHLMGLIGELPVDSLNPFGDYFLLTCGDEAGWSFDNWFSDQGAVVRHYFDQSIAWHNEAVTHHFFDKVEGHSAYFYVRWANGVTSTQKDAFVDGLTYWCFDLLNSGVLGETVHIPWIPAFPFPMLGCRASWEKDSIIFDVGIADKILSPPASTTYTATFVPLSSSVTCSSPDWDDLKLELEFWTQGLTMTCNGVTVNPPPVKREVAEVAEVAEIAEVAMFVASGSLPTEWKETRFFEALEYFALSSATFNTKSISITISDPTWMQEISNIVGTHAAPSDMPSQLSNGCPDYTVKLIVDEALRWSDCAKRLDGERKTRANYCNCLADLFDALGGTQCYVAIFDFVKFTPDFAKDALAQHSTSDVNFGTELQGAFDINDLNWDGLALALGVDLVETDINPFGNHYIFTCGEKAGWDFATWFDEMGGIIGDYYFDGALIWRNNKEVVTSHTYQGVEGNSVMFSVTWAPKVTNEIKDTFVEGLTYWCYEFMSSDTLGEAVDTHAFAYMGHWIPDFAMPIWGCEASRDGNNIAIKVGISNAPIRRPFGTVYNTTFTSEDPEFVCSNTEWLSLSHLFNFFSESMSASCGGKDILEPPLKRAVPEVTSAMYTGVLSSMVDPHDRLFARLDNELEDYPSIYLASLSIGITDETWMKTVSSVVDASSAEHLLVHWTVLLSCLIVCLLSL